ncbi:MAG: IS110 family transposase [Rhodothermaceae bacterium]|nr:IS110 family transposase [Rhodothermaceae bacterium]
MRGHLAEIDFIQSRIREVERQIRATSALPRFCESAQILRGFRGIGLMTAMQLICEIGDFCRFKSA